MALPLSWLNLFLPIMFLVITTSGAKRPFPSLTFFIIGIDRMGRATRKLVGGAATASPAMEVPQLPWKEEERPPLNPVAEIEVAIGTTRSRYWGNPFVFEENVRICVKRFDFLVFCGVLKSGMRRHVESHTSLGWLWIFHVIFLNT